MNCLSETITKTPKYIGKYKVLNVIGKGGFATVFLAENPSTTERVAIKRVNRHEITKQHFLF